MRIILWQPLLPLATTAAATDSMPVLRVCSGLSVHVEIHFINAGLPRRARLGAPFPGTEFDLTEFPDRQTTPNTGPFRRHRQTAMTVSANLINQSMQLGLLPAQNMRAQ